MKAWLSDEYPFFSRLAHILFSAALIATPLLSGFWQIADEMLEVKTLDFDSFVNRLLGGGPAGPWGPPWLQEAGGDDTALVSLKCSA